MTPEILISKTAYFNCDKPKTNRKADKKEYNLSSEKHLFNFLKNYHEKDKAINKHSNLVRLIVSLRK